MRLVRRCKRELLDVFNARLLLASEALGALVAHERRAVALVGRVDEAAQHVRRKCVAAASFRASEEEFALQGTGPQGLLGSPGTGHSRGLGLDCELARELCKGNTWARKPGGLEPSESVPGGMELTGVDRGDGDAVLAGDIGQERMTCRVEGPPTGLWHARPTGLTHSPGLMQPAAGPCREHLPARGPSNGAGVLAGAVDPPQSHTATIGAIREQRATNFELRRALSESEQAAVGDSSVRLLIARTGRAHSWFALDIGAN